MNSWTRRVRTGIPVIGCMLLLALAWEAGTVWLEIPHYIIPRLSDVFQSLIEHRGLLGKHFLVTLGEALLGLGIAVLSGVGTALLVDTVPLARRAVYPLIIASQTIPIIALSPIMVMWFGYGVWSKVSVVLLFTFFPIAVNTADGLRGADPEIGELMRSMGARRRDLFIKWKLPSALPGFFTGLKLAAAISVGGATLGEWLGGEAGLGMYTKRASNLLRGDAVFSGVLLLSLMGILLFLAVLVLERSVLAWRRR